MTEQEIYHWLCEEAADNLECPISFAATEIKRLKDQLEDFDRLKAQDANSMIDWMKDEAQNSSAVRDCPGSAGSERLAIKTVVDQVLELVQTKCEWDFDEPIDYISDGKGDFKRPATWQEKELRSALLEIERIIQNERGVS